MKTAGALSVIALAIAGVVLFATLYWYPSEVITVSGIDEVAIAINFASTTPLKDIHLKTPDFVRAIYMTSFVGGNKPFRLGLVDLVEKTELNSIVIDIKDYSGRIAFRVTDPLLKEVKSDSNRIPDVREFIDFLHSKTK